MPFLRQSTSQTVRFGVALDKTDGVTEETALTLAQADMRLSKDGGAFAQKNATGNATHDSDGWYSTTLDATDTNTVGELILNVHQPANMLPIWMRFWVLEEVIYDAIFGASAAGFDANQRVDVGSWLGTAVTTSATSTKPEVDVNSISDDATAANNAELMFDGTGYAGGTTKLGVNIVSTDDIDLSATQKTSVNAEVDSALIDAGVVLQVTTIATLASQTSFTLTAGSTDDDAYNKCWAIITDASTAAQKAVGYISDYTGSTKTVTLISDPGVFTMAATDKIAIISRSFTDLLAATQTSIDAIETDTNSLNDTKIPDTISLAAINAEADTAATDYGALKPTVGGRTLDVAATGEAGVDLGNVTGTLGNGNVGWVDANDRVDVGSWLGTAVTTNGTSNKPDVDLAAIDGATAAAVRIGLSAGQIIPFTVDNATFTPTTTQFEADDITEATADHFNHRIIIWTTGALVGQARFISDYELANSKGKFTVDTMTEAPANDDTGIII